jgi:carbon monoxide dehydrogenase subunit G
VELEKTLTVAAAPRQVWDLLLDPRVMAGCVPGMQSIEVVSPVEYVALMQVKIAFINAKFKLRTTVVEQRAPNYLRAEGTGEDASVASSFKQQSEIFLAPGADGGTELRLKAKVDLLGRLGAFGLNVMKTKADRMWDEFAAQLAARIGGPAEAAEAASPAAPAAIAAPAPMAASATPSATAAAAAPMAAAAPGWWSRLLGRPLATGAVIRVEVRRPDQTVVRVEWPLEGAATCQDWLRELLRIGS